MHIPNPFKDFLYFSREERRGILILITAIIVVFLSDFLYSYQSTKLLFTEEDIRQQAIALAEYKSFLASIQEKDKQWKERFFDDNSNKQKKEIILTSFDPNTADSVTFCQLGLPSWMAQNILHYRSKGGKFRKAEDFRKIYGLTEEHYQTLLPYLYISQKEASDHSVQLYTPPLTSDTVTPPRTDLYKYPSGIVVDLNRADTTELKKIPGIGSGIARLITNYRQRLGGFYRIEQLQEIHLNYHLLKPWFRIDSKEIRLINVNRAGIEKLRHHPYINFYQAKAFVEYRKKRGPLHNLKPFTIYEEFSDADLDKMSHYLCFE